jgi:D-alanyl-D-alanine carboxypeptidase (penicillin-binding protein 5/6)
MMRNLLRLAAILLLLPGLSMAATKPAAKKKPVDTSSDESETTSPFPATAGNGFPQVHAASVVILDAQTGHVMHEVNADQPRPVASTQKLLTSLIVAETGNLDAQVHVEAPDTWAEPSKLDIKPGETYRRGDLLRVLLVKSMNDVARCLARDNAGSIDAFAGRMNAKAAQLGMSSSHFLNPNGLPIPGQYSTARDMAKLAFAAYHNHTLRSIVCIKDLPWTYPSGRTTIFHNTNHVLHRFALCNGMKTGYTEAAGHCLVSSAVANGREVICVALGDNKDIWVDSYRLLNWGLSNGSVARN